MKKNKIFQKTIFVWITAGFCCFLWGSAFPGIKIGYNLFNIDSNDTATIILFAGLRFFLAGVLTIVIFSIINRKILLPGKKSIKKIGVLSLFQTILQYLFFYIGLAYTSGERASVIQGTNVFVALIISCLVFKMEKFKFNKIIGSVIGFAGVLLVSLDIFKASEKPSFIGEVLVFLSTVSYAFSSVFMKKYSKDDNPAMLSGWQFVLGGMVMIVSGLAFGGKLCNFSIKSITLLIYLAFVSAAAYSLWSILLKYNPVSKVTVCGFLTPVFGFILSAVFLGNLTSVGFFALLSLLCVVAGMIIVNYDFDKAQKSK